MSQTTACLIVIGNEILSGRTQDQNLSWLGIHLNECGVALQHARVIPDVEATIIATVNECRKTYDYVFTTGGIGPTHDDITSAAIANAFGVPLERNAEAEAILRSHYDTQEINQSRLKMADIPQGAELVANPISAAPGFRLENTYVFAGVPTIMQVMFNGIQHQLKGGLPTLSRAINVWMSEGTLAAGVSDIQDQFPEIEIGSYPWVKDGKLATSLILRSVDEQALERAHTALQDFVGSMGGEEIENI